MLSIVSCAIQQVLVGYLFYIQYCAYFNLKLPPLTFGDCKCVSYIQGYFSYANKFIFIWYLLYVVSKATIPTMWYTMCISSRATIYIQMLPFQEQEEQKEAPGERPREKKQQSAKGGPVVLMFPPPHFQSHKFSLPSVKHSLEVCRFRLISKVFVFFNIK